MSLEIDLINEQELPLDEQMNALLERVLRTAAELEQVVDAEVAVTFVDDQMIHNLNREYRGIDRSTDVLSFAMNEQTEEESVMVMEEGMPNMLGDIIVSVPHAVRQAESYGHSFAREMGFLVVHGFLHLLGYDHQTEEQEQAMFSRQEEILSRAGLGRTTTGESHE